MDAPTRFDTVKKVIIFNVCLFSFFFGIVHFIYRQIPTKNEIRSCMTTKNYHIYLCPESMDYVPLKQISPYVRKAIVMTEDSAFFHHQGFDWASIEKNAYDSFDPYTLEKKSFKRGGSTITQQLVKNLFFENKKTMYRKISEAFVTVQVEKTLNKNEILERYLNVIEFGKNIFGIRTASQFYFKKMPIELNIVESAFLAMILPNPIKYSTSHKKQQLTTFAKTRIKQIIDYLYQFKLITEEEYSQALDQFAHFLQQQPELENSWLTETNSDSLNNEQNSLNESDQINDNVEVQESKFDSFNKKKQKEYNSIKSNKRVEDEINGAEEDSDYIMNNSVDSLSSDESD